MQIIPKETSSILFSTLEEMIPCNSELLKELKSGKIAAGFLQVVSSEVLIFLTMCRKEHF